MSNSALQPSTGLTGLDAVLRGIIPGDTIVWQVDSVDDYLPFVEALADYVRRLEQKLTYFQLASHQPLLEESDWVEVRPLHPDRGFEPFLAGVHETIEQAPLGGFYVFDSLSQLPADWCSDRMLGNFFTLTCRVLHERAALAYFALLRDRHSFHAVRPISDSTRVLVNVYRENDETYIHPIKVQNRHSPTMYTLHVRHGDQFTPITGSSTITQTLSRAPWSRTDASSYTLGFWSRCFAEAEVLQWKIDTGEAPPDGAEECLNQLLRMVISHNEQVLALARKYLTLQDILDVRRRMIGTGRIGGKSVGMLLARAILRSADPRWSGILEPHDSFFIGADVFYTYLVQNDLWRFVRKQSTFEDKEASEEARRRMLTGKFPDYIVEQFADMLNYFGQSPIIVRSSSLLEDNFGAAFAGKYDSVFCSNQRERNDRLEEFLSAVRTVYASIMSEGALAYRSQRGLLTRDEQMALLVQRVSGARYGDRFYPQAAGVGFSFNPYVWHKTIDPEAGVLRLVFGLGTRAVDRADDDYTCVVALNAPGCRPESSLDEMREHAQRRVDVIDLAGNEHTSTSFEEIVADAPRLPLDMFASRDRRLERAIGRRRGKDVFSWVLTFTRLLSETGFVQDMRAILDTVEKAYDYPVDIEFTVNYFQPNRYQINLVQCRPLQVKGVGSQVDPPEDIPDSDLVLKSSGAVIGKGVLLDLDWVIYVSPAWYGNLPVAKRHGVARLIGELTAHKSIRDGRILLVGPGRWGTSSPSLGVPVTFAEIHPVSVLCEVVTMRENLVPDASLGTHFFNELVESDMLYLALTPNREGHLINESFFEDGAANRVADLLPAAGESSQGVIVCRAADLPDGVRLKLNANTLKQKVVCYLDRQPRKSAAEEAQHMAAKMSADSASSAG
jgi:hypothetical protein